MTTKTAPKKDKKPRAESVRDGKDLAKKISKATGVLPAPKPAAPVRPRAIASDSDVLAEARTIATGIRGLRRREDALSGELKEVRAKITTQTDHLNTLLLDSAAGQSRLPLGDPKPATSAPAATPPTPAKSPAPSRLLKAVHGAHTATLHTDHDDWIACVDGIQVGKFTAPGAAEGCVREKIGLKDSDPAIAWTEDGKPLADRSAFAPAKKDTKAA